MNVCGGPTGGTAAYQYFMTYSPVVCLLTRHPLGSADVSMDKPWSVLNDGARQRLYPPYVLMFFDTAHQQQQGKDQSWQQGADYKVTSDQLQPSSKAQEMETGSRNSSEVTGHRSICTRRPAPCICVRNARKMNSNRHCFLLPTLTTSSLLFLFWTKNRV